MDRRRSQRIKSIKKGSFSDSDSKSRDHANKNMNQNSNITESCKVISKLLLPEDLMFDILTFVPLNCLINSARYVCKHWAATIRSSNFAEAHKRRARSKHGLYVESLMSQSSSYFLEFNDDLNGQFERIDSGTPQRMGDIISTCDGILLLSTISRRIFVVNPILKCWLKIPPFPSSVQQHMLIKYQCTIACVPRTAKFKLFLLDVLEISGVFWYVFYVLRIGIDNSWKEIARKEAHHNVYLLWEPIYSGGNDLYWITIDKVIVMDVDKEVIVREYPLPTVRMLVGPIPIFLWMGNCLSCIACHDFYETYQILILDFDSGKWSLYHEMGPFDYVAACGHELHVWFVAFRLWINNQIIFQVAIRQYLIGNIFPSQKNIYFGYNVKTRQLTKIEGIDAGDFKVWLHTNSLVSLPSTPT